MSWYFYCSKYFLDIYLAPILFKDTGKLKAYAEGSRINMLLQNPVANFACNSRAKGNLILAFCSLFGMRRSRFILEVIALRYLS